jgi:hypothetical protein
MQPAAAKTRFRQSAITPHASLLKGQLTRQQIVTEMAAELTAAFFSKKILYGIHSAYILHSAFSRILCQ